MQNIRRKKSIYFFLLFSLQSTLFAQVSITGPRCVLPDLEYQYNISGDLSAITAIKWCIVGGAIAGPDSSCVSGNSRLIRVKWNSSRASGSIALDASGSKASIDVNITKPFDPGQVNPLSRLQDAKKNEAPYSITCSQPVGGSCTPKYSFQWEESTDGMKWSEIDGAAGADLKFTSKPKRTMYYRRRVIETRSKLIGLSDAALVLIKPGKNKIVDEKAHK